MSFIKLKNNNINDEICDKTKMSQNFRHTKTLTKVISFDFDRNFLYNQLQNCHL